jgi:hypothetical protein
MAKVFDISKEDKENFIQALYSILNLDRNYPDEEREFVYQLKVLMEINGFLPHTLDNEEKDLVKIIEQIKNKDLIHYLFLIAQEAEEKQTNKSDYNKKMKNIVEKLNPEIKSYIKTKYNDMKSDSVNIEKIATKAQEVREEIFTQGQKIFSSIFKKGDKK